MKAEVVKFSPLDCAIQCFRFFNGKIYFSNKSITSLLETLKCTKEERKAFFKLIENNCRLGDDQQHYYEHAQVRYLFNNNDSSDLKNVMFGIIDIIGRFHKDKLISPDLAFSF